MLLNRLDDHQSWCIEAGGKRLLLDPWLTDTYCVPPRPLAGLPAGWLLQRRHLSAQASLAALGRVDAVLLSAPYADHVDAATLDQLPRETLMFAPRSVIRTLRALGFRSLVAVGPRTRLRIGDRLVIEGVLAGGPYRLNSTGFVVRDLASRVALYCEAHIAPMAGHLPQAVDIALMPVEKAALLGVTFSQSAEQAVRAALNLGVRCVVASGSAPGAVAGVLGQLLHTPEAADDCRELLAGSAAATTLVDATAGERLQFGWRGGALQVDRRPPVRGRRAAVA